MTTEEEGVEAIMWLQVIAGIKETEEQARNGWSLMSELEKEFTMKAYKSMKKLYDGLSAVQEE